MQYGMIGDPDEGVAVIGIIVVGILAFGLYMFAMAYWKFILLVLGALAAAVGMWMWLGNPRPKSTATQASNPPQKE